MKKIVTYIFIFSIIVSGCGTHAAQGALTGSQVGSVLGSAIGGLSNGWRGRDVGTIAGLVGGAVVGGAIGNACDKAKENKSKKQDCERDDYYSDYEDNDYRRHAPRYMRQAELRNIIFYDEDDNGILSAGENAEIVFEIYNNSSETLYDVVPTVEQTTKMKHIQISKSQTIGRIEPGRTVRYTAFIRTGSKLKNGSAVFSISVTNSSERLLAPRTEFEVETRR